MTTTTRLRDRNRRPVLGRLAALALLVAASAPSSITFTTVLASSSKVSLGNNITMMSPMNDALTQNSPGNSEGYAAGVPRNFAWYCGYYQPAEGSAPPPKFTAVTGWGQIYPKVGAPKYPGVPASVTIANAKTYVHLSNTREWILVQNQAETPIAGGHFVADFSGNAAREMKMKVLPDGGVAVDPPPSGYNNHFWVAKRGTYPAGSVDAVYVQMDMRTSDPNIKLVANVGADWWRDRTAGYVAGFGNNPGAGMSNWVELSTAWSTLRFHSWSTSKLRANPPPPLVRAEPKISRRTNKAPPCLMGS